MNGNGFKVYRNRQCSGNYQKVSKAVCQFPNRKRPLLRTFLFKLKPYWT